MPKYFQNKNEMLHSEALATLILLEDKYFNSKSVAETERLVHLVNNARARVVRRWERLG